MSLSLQSNRDNQLYDQQLFNRMTSPVRRPLYLPSPVAKGNVLGSFQMFGDAFADLKNTFSNRELKKELYKKSLPDYYTYTVDQADNDPNEYVLDTKDLYDAMMGEGNLRTSDAYQRDLEKYSMVNFNPESGKYNLFPSSRPIDQSLYPGYSDIFGEGSKSLGQIKKDIMGNQQLMDLITQAEGAPEGFFPFMLPDGTMGVTEDPEYMQYYYDTMMGNYEMGGSLPYYQVKGDVNIEDLDDVILNSSTLSFIPDADFVKRNPNDYKYRSIFDTPSETYGIDLEQYPGIFHLYDQSNPDNPRGVQFLPFLEEGTSGLVDTSVDYGFLPTSVIRAEGKNSIVLPYGIRKKNKKKTIDLNLSEGYDPNIPNSAGKAYYDPQGNFLGWDYKTDEQRAKDRVINDPDLNDRQKRRLLKRIENQGLISFTTPGGGRSYIPQTGDLPIELVEQALNSRTFIPQEDREQTYYSGNAFDEDVNIDYYNRMNLKIPLSDRDRGLIDDSLNRLPSGLYDSPIVDKLRESTPETAEDFADLYWKLSNSLTGEDVGIRDFKRAFKNNKSDLINIIDESNITKDDLRDFIYNSDFVGYDDLGGFAQRGVDLFANRYIDDLYEKQHGGSLPKAQYNTPGVYTDAGVQEYKPVLIDKEASDQNAANVYSSDSNDDSWATFQFSRDKDDNQPGWFQTLFGVDPLNYFQRLATGYEAADGSSRVPQNYNSWLDYAMMRGAYDFLEGIDPGADKTEKVIDYAAMVGAFTPLYPYAYAWSIGRGLEAGDNFTVGADIAALAAKQHPATHAALKVFGKVGPKIPSLFNKLLTKTGLKNPAEEFTQSIYDELVKFPEYLDMGEEYLKEQAEIIGQGLYDVYENANEYEYVGPDQTTTPSQVREYGGLIKAQAGLSFEEWFIQNQVRASGMTEAEARRAYDQDTMDPQEFAEKYMDADFTIDEVPMPRLEDDPETMPFDLALGDIEIDEVPMPRLEDDVTIASPTVTGKKDNLSRFLDSPFAQGYGAIGRSAVGVAQGLIPLFLDDRASDAKVDTMNTLSADNAFMVTNPLTPQGTVDVNTGLRMTSGGFGLKAKFGTETEMQVEADPETIKALMDAGVNVNYI